MISRSASNIKNRLSTAKTIIRATVTTTAKTSAARKTA